MEMYLLQPSFAGGEISSEVANRVDIEKYQSALLDAENVVIKPYGGIAKRQGTEYVGMAKHGDKKCILVEFAESANDSYMLEVGEKYIRVWKDGVYRGIELVTPFVENDLSNLRFNQSADVMYICSGEHPVQELRRKSDTVWTIGAFKWSSPYFDIANGVALDGSEATITPSGADGNITLTASSDVFTSTMVGAQLQISQEIAANTVSLTVSSGATKETGSLLCGQGWKILSHGKWGGTITILQSKDGTTWKEYRKYTGKYADGTGDLNVSESGTFDEKTYVKVKVTCNGGTCECDLSVYGYTHTGVAEITAVTAGNKANAKVIEKLGNTEETSDFAFSVWNGAYGYPSCSAFFQDRLCFAGNTYYPHSIWMSRSGDYYNFSVEKANGTVTDDSAIMASLISRKMYKINHLVPGQDLAVLTNGNEWIISGGDVVTPANINPKMQTTRGSNECEPLFIGSRVIYVQRRGGTVRDMGYSFEADNYVGDDLTQLAKHLVNGYDLIDSAYCQEPYSIVHFVRSDGALVELTYIREQNVYAWAHSVLGGRVLSVCAVPSMEEDVLYVAVQREVSGVLRTYIERMAKYCMSEDVMDHTCMDCSVRFVNEAAVSSVQAKNLAGMTVQVMADGRRLPDVTVGDDGAVVLLTPAKRVTVGLPILMRVELPNVETETRNGTMQGRKKDVKEVFLRLERSLGGRVGQRSDALDMIQYDEMYETGAYPLYTGDKHATVPVNFNDSGRVIIEHDDPMPFSLCSVVRKVQFDG